MVILITVEGLLMVDAISYLPMGYTKPT